MCIRDSSQDRAGGSSRAQLPGQREVMRADVHPLHEVETMCTEALHTGVEMQLRAALRARMLDEPRHQCAPDPTAPLLCVGDQIVDVERFAPRQPFADTEARATDNVVVLLCIEQLPSCLRALPARLSEKSQFIELRAQLLQDAPATRARRVVLSEREPESHESVPSAGGGVMV